MLDAETKRYIDLAIASLRKELLAALPKAQTFVQNAGHADEADHAGKADFVVMIEGSTNVHIDGMSISVDVPAISELMEEGEGFVLVNGNTGSVALVEGSTNVHIYGSTIAVDEPDISDLLVEGTGFVLVNGNTGSIALVEGSTNVHIYGNTISVDVGGGTGGGGGLEPPDYRSQNSLAMQSDYTTTSSGFLYGYIMVGTGSQPGEEVQLKSGNTVLTTIYKIPQSGGDGEYIPFNYVLPSGFSFRIDGNIGDFSVACWFSGTLAP